METYPTVELRLRPEDAIVFFSTGYKRVDLESVPVEHPPSSKR